jgi:hypothetical protein
MEKQVEIFFPVMLMVFHTIFVYFLLGFRRFMAISHLPASIDYYKLYIGKEAVKPRVVSRHVINLLEAPSLFYLGAIIAFVTGQSSSLILVLAWTYVSLRVIHSVIHLGRNVVIWRFGVFVLSMIVLTAFLIVITYGLFQAH